MNRFFTILLSFTLLPFNFYAQEFKLISDYNTASDGFTGSYVSDINQDGYDDILYADRRDIFAFINKANGKFEFEKLQLHRDQSPIKTFKLWDMDNDGDLDILVGVTGRIIEIENKSTPEKLSFVKVSKDLYFQGVQFSAVPVFAIEYLNVDTLYDIVTSYGKTKILYQKPDSTFFDYDIPNGPFLDVQKIAVEDLDDDNINDLVFGRKGKANEPGLFYLLNASNTYSTQKTLINGDIKDFLVTDLDGDDKKDILAIADGENRDLTLLQNTGLLDSLYSTDSLNVGDLNTYSSFAIKKVQNNKLNILAGSSQKSTLAWFDVEFDDDMIIWQKTDLNTPEVITKQLFFTDLDKDGDDDILQMLDDNGFNIYQRINPSNALDISLQTKIYPNPTNNILNISSNQNITALKIKDIFGQSIMTITGINESVFTVNLDNINAGYYIIETVSSPNLSHFSRLVVVK